MVGIMKNNYTFSGDMNFSRNIKGGETELFLRNVAYLTFRSIKRTWDEKIP